VVLATELFIRLFGDLLAPAASAFFFRGICLLDGCAKK
jgi:hypothetical protein